MSDSTKALRVELDQKLAEAKTTISQFDSMVTLTFDTKDRVHARMLYDDIVELQSRNLPLILTWGNSDVG
jgi:hypothetical protein